MTWSTNGFAGTILILDGKFSINGDRGILVPKNGRQDLDFDWKPYSGSWLKGEKAITEKMNLRNYILRC